MNASGFHAPGEDAGDPYVVQDLGDGPVLVVSRCPRCADVRYPPRAWCPVDLTPAAVVPASRTGVVYEAVPVRVAPAGFEAPYWAVYVDLPERVRVFAPFRADGAGGAGGVEPHHGLAVRYETVPVGPQERGLLGPVFVPASGS